MYRAVVSGMIGHRPEALEAAGAGAEEELFADPGDHAVAVGDDPGLGVDVEDVLVAEVDGAGERAARPVELPEDGELAHAEDRLLLVVVDQDPLERLVHVVAVAGDVLEVPLHLAGGGVEGQGRVAVERVAVGAAGVARPRLGLGRPVEDEAGRGVVAAGNPRVAAGAEQQRQVAPGVAAALAGAGDGRGPPEHLAGAGVDPDDVAGVLAEPLAPPQPRHDDAAGDDRAAREAVARPRSGMTGVSQRTSPVRASSPTTWASTVFRRMRSS